IRKRKVSRRWGNTDARSDGAGSKGDPSRNFTFSRTELRSRQRYSIPKPGGQTGIWLDDKLGNDDPAWWHACHDARRRRRIGFAAAHCTDANCYPANHTEGRHTRASSRNVRCARVAVTRKTIRKFIPRGGSRSTRCRGWREKLGMDQERRADSD